MILGMQNRLKQDPRQSTHFKTSANVGLLQENGTNV
jgi:hypothetical protein